MTQERRTVSVRTRVTAGERSDLEGQAKATGVTLSELIRRRACGHRIAASQDRDGSAALERAIGQLNRIGGLLKLVHVESGGAYSTATAAALCELRETVEALRRGRIPKDPGRQ